MMPFMTGQVDLRTAAAAFDRSTVAATGKAAEDERAQVLSQSPLEKFGYRTTGIDARPRPTNPAPPARRRVDLASDGLRHATTSTPCRTARTRSSPAAGLAWNANGAHRLRSGTPLTGLNQITRVPAANGPEADRTSPCCAPTPPVTAPLRPTAQGVTDSNRQTRRTDPVTTPRRATPETRRTRHGATAECTANSPSSGRRATR